MCQLNLIISNELKHFASNLATPELCENGKSLSPVGGQSFTSGEPQVQNSYIVRYKKLVSYSLLMIIVIFLLNDSANASNSNNKSHPECHHLDLVTNTHTNPQLYSHQKLHSVKPHNCASRSKLKLAENAIASQANARKLDDLEKNITVREALTSVSHISGRILSITGTSIANVKITALGKTEVVPMVMSQSDSNGEFSLSLEAETQYVLQLSAENFSTQTIPITSPSTNTSLKLNNLVMAERGETQSVEVEGELTVEAADGASVTFDKANFVDADGQPLSGDMQLTITPLDISNTRSIKAFPGLFLGVSQENIIPEMIISLGVVEFHFTHNGEPVNLASGATAEVLIPIYVNQYPNGQAIEVGQTTPLRSLNETTGIWSQEGIGTIVYSTDSPTGFAYQATVTHFSWWGSDVAVSTPSGDTTPNTGVASAVITINAPAGIEGFAVFEATAEGLVNWRGSTVNTNVDIGDSSPSLEIPANRDVCFIAYIYFASGATSTSNEECINVASQAIVNLYIDLGQAGPIDVIVAPQVSDDTAFIQGFINIQSPALRIAATTIETTINYQLFSGSLPAGLSLDIFDNVLNLTGVPTALGEETFVIRASDADGNTDDITVTYNVSSVNPPPIIVQDSDRFFVGEITTLTGTVQANLNDLAINIGGPITQWQEVSSVPDQEECNSMYSAANIKGASVDLNLPASVNLNPTTGQLTFNSPEFWLSCLKATNDQGTSIFLFGFQITNVSPPPIIDDNTDRFFAGEITTLGGTVQMNLNDLVINIGGPITEWQEVTSVADQNACLNMYSSTGIKGASPSLELPTSVALNPTTGQLTFNSAEFCLSCLKAVNSQGESIFLFGFEITNSY